jgi:hypothetical protein
MDLTELQIIPFLFHPRVVKCVTRKLGICGTVMEKTGKTPSHRIVKFAFTLPIGNVADTIRSHVLHWLRMKRMYMVCSNFGVIDENDAHILGSDILLAHEPSLKRSNRRDAVLTMCTLVLHSNATRQEVLHAHEHARRLQHLLCVSYNIRCRSVVLIWGLNEKLSESWLERDRPESLS